MVYMEMMLTQRQYLFWRLRILGLSIIEIAKKFNISRQAVHKCLRSADAKIYNALTSVARANRVMIKKVDVRNGFLIGWSPIFKTEVFITYSFKNGVQVWFKHEGDCKNCSLRDECRSIILSEAKERNITLSNINEEPTKLAEEFFNKLIKLSR